MAGTCAADVHDFQMIQYDDMFPLLMLKPCCHSAADYIIATNRTATGHWIDSDRSPVNHSTSSSESQSQGGRSC